MNNFFSISKYWDFLKSQRKKNLLNGPTFYNIKLDSNTFSKPKLNILLNRKKWLKSAVKLQNVESI